MKSIAIVLLVFLYSSVAQANWTLNAGYQNPAVSTWGLNLLYMGSSWGFEAGIGWFNADANFDDDDSDDDDGSPSNRSRVDDEDDDDNASIALIGDIDIKYFFSSGKLRPFVQAGVVIGMGARAGDRSGAGAGTGSGFAGIGVLLGSPAFYGYGSYDMGRSQNGFVQAGLGIDI